MASIKKYKTATGYAWRVQYRSPDGRSRTKQGFQTKADAELWASRHVTSVADGAWTKPEHGRTTVAELYSEWTALRSHLKPSSQRTDRLAWENHVSPRWGHVPVGTIRRLDIQHWISESTLSRASIGHHHRVLAGILDLAVEHQYIRVNPARGVRLPRSAGGVRVYLSASQLRLLAECATTKGELIWLLGTSGLRWGEAVGLQVGDINFQSGRIKVQRNAVKVDSAIVVGTPKTHERREVVVPRHVMRQLRDVCRGKRKSDWLWESPKGGPLRPPGPGGFFDTAVKRACKADPEFPHHLTPHGLRHVAAGLLVSSGANVKVVQRQLGHKSAAMTLDTYADLFDNDLDEVAEAMEQLFSNVVGLSWG